MAERGGITIVGLGPGPEALWTLAASRAITASPRLWLRTRRHPSAAPVLLLRPDAQSFDDLYDRYAELPAVYAAVTEQLLDETASGDICYAVPGSPAVGEATVGLIRSGAAAAGIAVQEVPGVSFLSPVLTALGWDALDGLQVADTMDLAHRHHPPFDPDRPVLLAQAFSRLVAGDAKLILLGQYPPDHPVLLVRGAGTPRESVEEMRLADLDRRDTFDDETTLAIPALTCGRPGHGSAPVGGSLQTLAEMMARLRAPDGCPWDLKQSHESLGPFLLEEAHEVLAAIDSRDDAALKGELGDLLLQVVFHAQIASEDARFTVHDVVCAVTDKIVARHPHVFGDEHAASAKDVEDRWEDLKRREREAVGSVDDPFEGIPATLPALARARQVQERAERIGAAPSAEVPQGTDTTEEAIAAALWQIVAQARSAGIDAEGALRRLAAQRIDEARAALTTRQR